MKKPDNPELMNLIRVLKSKAAEYNASVWKALAKNLEKSKHRRRVVNISRINRYTKDGEIVAVPGKVLASGALDHTISVVAFQFSEEAKRKIEAVGGKCLTFSALIEKNHQGKDLKIIG